MSQVPTQTTTAPHVQSLVGNIRFSDPYEVTPTTIALVMRLDAGKKLHPDEIVKYRRGMYQVRRLMATGLTSAEELLTARSLELHEMFLAEQASAPANARKYVLQRQPAPYARVDHT